MALETTPDESAADSSGGVGSVCSGRMIFVDLDGTLIRTDLFSESAVALLKQSPWRLLAALPRLAAGRAALKHALSQAAQLNTRRLPLHDETLSFLADERAQGATLVLATASDGAWAQVVADDLAIFDDVLASDGQRNLRGSEKLLAIREYCAERGQTEFDYVGDSWADVPIWRAARRACLVRPSAGLLRYVSGFTAPTVVGHRQSLLLPMIKAMRPHQWVKNALLLVPLVMSHNVFNAGLAAATAVAFACFCLCASAAYLLNDVLDIDSDRRHISKRRRPFASGDLPISHGVPLAAGLLASGLGVSVWSMPLAFSATLVGYFLATCLYSLWAKSMAIIDVQFLAGLYALRVFAGGAATGIVVSEWLMAFSLFFFVSLAFAKRYAELERLLQQEKTQAHGRGYRVADLALVSMMGVASGYIAVLVLALYVNDEQSSLLYSTPWYLWLICPLLLYWINRVWLQATRGELSEDPIVFALRDKVSLWLGVAVAGLMLAASLSGGG